MGFGSVSRRTNPLEVSSFCCLCRVLRKAFSPTTVVVKQSQLGNAELPPPPAAPCAVLRSTGDFHFLSTSLHVPSSVFLLSATICLASDEMP